MIKDCTIIVTPELASDEHLIKQEVFKQYVINPKLCTGFRIEKRSIDARAKQVKILLSCKVWLQEPFQFNHPTIRYLDVHAKQEVHIIGAGPAGLFCALKLIELGLKPIILERGKDVRSRRRDLAVLNKNGILNEESNYCFGEGGAGTYSDGKLYTRSGKRGNVQRILEIFHQFGATENILVDAHPHIGTNKLPQIITAIREQIIASGGSILFETKLLDITIKEEKIKSIETSNGKMDVQHLILATGHSAEDMYTILQKNKVVIHAKPLAIGVRVEHPQSFIDQTQYHQTEKNKYLPPASYKLVQQINGKGVFSFCMCPGGIIASASTHHNRLVVNGWSPSKRNNEYANSGMVVAINESDYQSFSSKGALAAMYYQESIEQKAFAAGGGKFVAPAQRISDFVNHKVSQSLPNCSYLPGVTSVALNQVLPQTIYQSLALGFKEFDKKMKGYIQQDAIVVATESRTSSPVSIPRDATTCEHIQIKGLFPCGEGAGYAGGIVSAAMDGERIAFAVYQKIESGN